MTTPDPTSTPALDVTLGVAAVSDVEWLVPMMIEFNAGEGIALERATLRPVLERLLRDESLGRVWLIARAGETVGYAVLTFGFDLEYGGRDAFLTELYLRPEARGRGVGRIALHRIEAAARSLGARAIHLMVRPENRPAVALYAGAGFTAPPRALLSKLLA